MNKLQLQNKFYDAFNENLSFINRLHDNNSNALTILCGSYALLDEFFSNNENDYQYDEIFKIFEKKDFLEKTVDFFLYRLNILLELDKLYDEDYFEELIPTLYYKLCFEEIKNEFNEELVKLGWDDIVNEKINYLNVYINSGKYLINTQEDEISLTLESISKEVSEKPTLSMIIYNLFEELMNIKFEQDEMYNDEDEMDEDYDEDEENLDNINLQISVLVGHATKCVNKELLKLKNNHLIYKEIIKYKQLVDKCLFLTEVRNLDYQELCEKLGFSFRIYSTFCVTLYLESIRLLQSEYKFLDIQNASNDELYKIVKFIQISSLYYFINTLSEEDLIDEINRNNYKILKDIKKNKINIDELDEMLEVISIELFDILNVEFESLQDFIKYILEKLSHVCNEFY